jgi:hypothetical protein
MSLLRPSTLPTVTVTPLSGDQSHATVFVAKTAPWHWILIHRVPDGWKRSQDRVATHETLYGLIDDWMAANGYQSDGYNLDASAVRNPA